MLKVGLTGGIACGKSYVLRRLAAAGLGTLDLDAVAHDVMARGGTAHADVVNEFGSGILAADGEVDRQRLGDLVFADPDARARLNALVHPRVREEEARRAAAEER
ncbi:MAG TPA: dephospho-CoA kinase, partial [Vicinamibacteria bacterium]